MEPPSGRDDLRPQTNLDEISDIHRHLLHLGVVERLNVLQRSAVLARHKVYGHSFPAKSPSTTDPKYQPHDNILTDVLLQNVLTVKQFSCKTQMNFKPIAVSRQKKKLSNSPEY